MKFTMAFASAGIGNFDKTMQAHTQDAQANDKHGLEQASENIIQFVYDLQLNDVVYTERDVAGDSSDKCFYGYKLICNDRSALISMPSLPLKEIKYINEKLSRISQSEFPKLLINDNALDWYDALCGVKNIFINTPVNISSY